MTSASDVVVVGAGLAGLAAARRLHEAGRQVTVLERADGPGGRVRTDVVDGFRLDRGFQILLTAYPEARRVLDLPGLDLRPFDPGAEVWVDGRFHRVGDPVRQPATLVSTLRAPIGGLVDKARILQLRQRVRRGEPEDLLRRPDRSARAALVELGFSSTMIDRFFRPLFAGVTLDAELGGSSRQLEFVFRMLSEGPAAVPARGMGQIAEQLVDALPAGTVHLDTAVAEVAADGVTTEDGERFAADAVIVATDLTDAARLGLVPDGSWNGVTSAWFAADEPPRHTRSILLDGSGVGPAMDVAVMSSVSPEYAPSGQALIVASTPTVDEGVDDAVRAQMRRWFGPTVDGWRRLRTDRVPHAQPRLGLGYDPDPPVVLDSGVFVAGDHRADPSINGALRSGRRAAEAVLDRL